MRRRPKQTKLNKKLKTYSKAKFNGAFRKLDVSSEMFGGIPPMPNTKSLTHSTINR